MKKQHRNKTQSRKKSLGNTLVGLFVGLVIGVLVAAGVVWYIFKTPAPFSSKFQSSPSTATPSSPANTAQPAPPMALPGKPGDPIPQAGDKPRFDFYKILPGNSEAIPDPKPAAKPNEPKQAEANKDKESRETVLKEPVFLQTGSFQNAGDADNQKARLAMLGVEAGHRHVRELLPPALRALGGAASLRATVGPVKAARTVEAPRNEAERDVERDGDGPDGELGRCRHPQ